MLAIPVSTSRTLNLKLLFSGTRPIAPYRRHLLLSKISCSSKPSNGDDAAASIRLDYDPFHGFLGLDVKPQQRNQIINTKTIRSWFGPNGQYIRELPCPSCRGRGYTPCTRCGIERSRKDCSECNGKGIKTCQQCHGDRVIWEESIDEKAWERAHSSSPLKVKDDDEVDNLEIKVDVTRRSRRVYRSPSPEVGLKISQSLKMLNAETGLFSKRMKILHADPKFRAHMIAAVKKAKGTEEARKHASETMKAYFSNPDNRLKRSIAMKGVKFYCSHCGEEGHRRHYCPSLREDSKRIRFRCQLCGELGHNRRTCRKNPQRAEILHQRGGKSRSNRCSICGQTGHNRRNCPERVESDSCDEKCNPQATTSSSKHIPSPSGGSKPNHTARKRRGRKKSWSDEVKGPPE